MSKKIIVIGGGPGGYAAAIKAAQIGAEVTLAEASQIGGTCLNVGCIPTKALLHIGEFFRRASQNTVAGVNISGAALDWQKAQAHKDEIAARLTGGVSALLQHNGVTVYSEKAVPLSGQKVKIGDKTFDADAVILALGSVSAMPAFTGHDLPGVIDSTEALSLMQVPKSIAIIGGGVIGVEFAALYSSLGAKTTVIEALPEILPSIDGEIAEIMRGALGRDGVDVFTGARIVDIAQSSGGLRVRFDNGDEEQTLTAERVLVATGRSPNTASLEQTGVKMIGGAVDVDKHFLTNIPNLYAVGDCNGTAMLAHAAMAQGIAATEHIMGVPPRYNAKIVPSCIYASPEIAAVGMTEQQAAESEIEYRVGRFSLIGNGRAIIDGEEGLIKVIAEKRFGEILGVHMIGPRVTEMIAEAALCMSMEGTVEDIVTTIHAHPTVSEAFQEAAMSVFGNPIHGVRSGIES